MDKNTSKEWILVLDFGSQYTQLIARRIRECDVYSEIKPYHYPVQKIKENRPAGIVLSGGPSSVYADQAPLPDPEIFELGIPVLGICYGLQVIAHLMGGEVDRARRREYGRAALTLLSDEDLFDGVDNPTQVWMSHGDHLTRLPEGFEVIASTENSPIAAIRHPEKKIFGIQFHPEVVHTLQGMEIFRNFLFNVCRCEGNWSPESFLKTTIRSIRKTVGSGRVICGVSGGVDSTVVAELLHRSIGDQLTAIFIDNGLLRKGEAKWVQNFFRKQLNIQLHFVDGSRDFLDRLKGVVDPEKKRKIIGEVFIRLFEAEAKKLGHVEFLAQGTLYPDVIESVSTVGPSASIKSHHNVGGLPEKMSFKLIEPLRELFKDEVRKIGALLGIPDDILNRHPFPGPGLAVRIVGEITEERLNILREADDIFINTLREQGWYEKVWQALAVLLPVKSVGVMGDERTYGNVVALRAVTSQDGMTADWAQLPFDLLGRVSNQIINQIARVNRVVYDISSKPPSTIEWE
ncbi:MAG: glutamine-hydrolyzing GMP synthase [Calditrichaeota bacterium]|nr:glutamine-hydrolyzing GMP synthase [Calditrichota bacterium]